MVLVACPKAYIGSMSAGNSHVPDNSECMIDEGFLKETEVQGISFDNLSGALLFFLLLVIEA